MDRQTVLGIILGGLGIAAGAAVSAYLALHPEAATLLWWSALVTSGVLVVLGVVVVAWPRKGAVMTNYIRVAKMSGKTIFDISDGAKVVSEGLEANNFETFAKVDKNSELHLRDTKLNPEPKEKPRPARRFFSGWRPEKPEK